MPAKTTRALEFLLSFGLAYWVDWLLRGPIQAFCQEPGYLALVSCLFLENPILVMLLIFLLILGGLELVRLELGDQLGKLGRKIKRWLKSHL